MNLIDKNIEAIKILCEKHRVKEFYVFGSVLTDKFNDLSDIDVLVQFGQVDLLRYFDNYMDLKEELEKLLKRPVDLVEKSSYKKSNFSTYS
ncbi:MAG TPA: nucleotidyltransferase domain-containing protein [Prolixibacteraceae bacterium]|jgi:predicted nucleotidyltransferase|nr:nucleotidyltransferase domain-containing protein [Prolixibacteraceae bacterium]HRV89839.1 nucleotidyltransferase domain-containing protein [Prolixibacteraceae bacterium]